MNKRAAALIFVILVIVVLAILGAAMLSGSISNSRITKIHKESAQAFWLAEAAANRALNELRTNYAQTGNNLWLTALGEGEYSVDVAVIGQNRLVTAYGYIPSASQPRAERIVQVVISRSIPPDFYEYAIYSAGEVDLNGNSYSITAEDGDPNNPAIVYADELDANHPENIVGTITHDSSVSPLPRFDFPQLLSLSQAQGNVYDENRLQAVQRGNDSFPSSFWYTRADDSLDNDNDGSVDEADEWVPNINYVESDLQLNGNIGVIGGFFVVVGDVITDPEETQDASINGNGQIEGVIYTRGEFDINGGGQNLNINGGVWAGEEAELNGNSQVAYNRNYLSAIEALGLTAGAQITSWRENLNPYPLVP